eukprot:CAMPEP_0114579004 /NCGR_PEP_ID=MMETSP0125-20121206/3466_1 /TAXON_ID=485358 ORGANISM="Aristerostoma sp., Strain ATCC 50986" /NCGR_SAMPLE_ID=MMETSP0125 /ASSEMBLY_ACC=CAM_ASM_000245 /LENGTH=105 /DNA_ID=CAMNT_0001769485 /DNA_START=1402 /DNA_END=1719 /DNA_ORIENTATION=+
MAMAKQKLMSLISPIKINQMQMISATIWLLLKRSFHSVISQPPKDKVVHPINLLRNKSSNKLGLKTSLFQRIWRAIDINKNKLKMKVRLNPMLETLRAKKRNRRA